MSLWQKQLTSGEAGGQEIFLACYSGKVDPVGNFGHLPIGIEKKGD